MIRVVAAIVTHRRPAELRRLLDSLAGSSLPLAGCVISDHAPTGQTARMPAHMPFETLVLEDASNPGPGAGWANAAQKAVEHFGSGLDAIWYLDDDVIIPPDALEILWHEMSAAGAEAIAPLLWNQNGDLWAFPEPDAPALRKTIRQANTPAKARQLLGESPLPFCWCTGACFLVTKTGLEKAGWHRRDFWLLGEDLEYSMRVASLAKAVFTCKVSVAHLPPDSADPQAARRADYAKFCSLLQNLSYLSFHSPHSRHMRFYLPGNFRRFFRTHGLRPRVFRDAFACFWNGAAKSQPSGTPSGESLRARVKRYDWGS